MQVLDRAIKTHTRTYEGIQQYLCRCRCMQVLESAKESILISARMPTPAYVTSHALRYSRDRDEYKWGQQRIKIIVFHSQVKVSTYTGRPASHREIALCETDRI
jgi:predicted NAD-dependent protein-ADP-ribosyltransferase YbiA (DUF1768 family)